MRQYTELPLHGGHAPRWLFSRMVKLGRAIGLVIIDEFGADELIARLGDSNWLQALSCAIGYDWHSSGTTTVTMGALKEGLNDTGEVFIAGGKGKAGLKTPEDITAGVDALSIPRQDAEFKELSRLSAKIDSAMVYDHVGIYHHTFAFSKNSKWTVVQQAMDTKRDTAIRFQWHSEGVDMRDIANEPHSAIAAPVRQLTLDLTNHENKWARDGSIGALGECGRYIKEGKIAYPARHGIVPEVDISRRGLEAIKAAGEIDPKDYRELLLIRGVGRSTLRSLAFVSSIIYGNELAYTDPVTYAYNLGGKDGIPFPVDRRTYDSVIQAMGQIIDQARLEPGEKYLALRRLGAQVR